MWCVGEWWDKWLEMDRDCNVWGSEIRFVWCRVYVWYIMWGVSVVAGWLWFSVLRVWGLGGVLVAVWGRNYVWFGSGCGSWCPIIGRNTAETMGLITTNYEQLTHGPGRWRLTYGGKFPEKCTIWKLRSGKLRKQKNAQTQTNIPIHITFVIFRENMFYCAKKYM